MSHYEDITFSIYDKIDNFYLFWPIFESKNNFWFKNRPKSEPLNEDQNDIYVKTKMRVSRVQFIRCLLQSMPNGLLP